jgi:photosystem II stability/assembly factor-like uncharacterized protein
MKLLSSRVVAIALAVTGLVPAFAQTPPPVAPEAAAIKSLTWRAIGPANQAGRISVIVGVPGDPSTYYVSGANGGIFKTTNGGTTFTAIFDDQSVLSIGAIAIAPSDPNVLYVGTGEGNPRNNASFGDGVYKSIDGGAHWTHVGLADTDKIARIVIDPKNPDIAYVAALGHEWGPNEERGLFKTIDGGKSWKKVLYKNDQTGCSDVDIDPANANIVYAGMYTFRRWAWHLDSGGGETALYKSVDGGATWQRLTNGLPKGPMDRIGISVARSNPSVVYVVSETKDEGELWRTDDAGESWRVVNRDPNINFRPFYYSDIRGDPSDPNTIYSLSGSLYKSEDSGRTFARIANGVHGDHQAMWIDPTNHKRVLSGSDGGFQVSDDAAKTFEVINTVAFTQFYHINYDMQTPYMLCGGLQDNGTWCGPSNSLASEGIRKRDWFVVGGGDGFFAVPDLSKPWLVYNNLQGGSISLTDTRSGASRNIVPYPNRIGSVGDAMENHKYRFNWNSPIALSPQDPKTVYFGGNVLFRTTDYGMSWTVISPDLSTNDKSKQKSSGGPIVVDNTAAEFHCTILTIAPSPVDANVIWVGTDDGNVQVTRDGGKTWTNAIKNVQGLAPAAWIPTVEASHFDAGTAYFVADHHQDNDYAPYAFKTTDYGKTWKAVTGTGLPAKGWGHVIREDPRNRNLLYLGTELGVYASWDGGGRWVDIRNGLPPVPVRDIQIHPRDHDVILGTHGRGAYILDDATPLTQMADAIAAGTYAFDVRPAIRWAIWGKDADLGQQEYAADNPAPGAYISYYAKTAPQNVAIAIVDGSGKTVRQIRNPPKGAGVNRAAWDLRFDALEAPGGGGRGGGGRGAAAAGGEEGEAPAGRGRFGGPAAGPAVLPGDYTAKISIDGKEFTKPIKVTLDPRVEVSTADLQAQLDASFEMMRLSQRVNAIVDRVDGLIAQLTSLEEQLGARGTRRITTANTDGQNGGNQGANQAGGDVLTLARSTRESLKKFRDDELARPLPGLGYRQYPRLREEVGTVSGSISRAWTRPTAGEMLRMKELQEETNQAAAKLNTFLAGDVAKINQMMSGTPRILGEPIK